MTLLSKIKYFLRDFPLFLFNLINKYIFGGLELWKDYNTRVGYAWYAVEHQHIRTPHGQKCQWMLFRRIQTKI